MRAFKQVDVFTNRALCGNPVAVLLDGTGLSDAQMQQIALWTNLSETTFVLPGDDAADYHVRIFTPRAELPFAGHPTLGTAFALLDAGRVTPKNGTLVQRCAVGLVELSVAPDWRREGLSFKLPHYRFAPLPEPLAPVLGEGVMIGAGCVVDVGPHWLIAEVADVSALAIDFPALAAYNLRTATTGLTVFAETGGGDIAVRSFAPADGINEDPVCGSGNGAVAAYRLRAGRIGDGDAYTARQGREAGRDGFVKVHAVGSDLHIGGCCVCVVDGCFAI